MFNSPSHWHCTSLLAIFGAALTHCSSQSQGERTGVPSVNQEDRLFWPSKKMPRTRAQSQSQDTLLNPTVQTGKTERDKNSIKLSVPTFNGEPLRYFVWRDHFTLWARTLNVDTYLAQAPISKADLEKDDNKDRKEKEEATFMYLRTALTDEMANIIMAITPQWGYNGTQALRVLDQYMDRLKPTTILQLNAEIQGVTIYPDKNIHSKLASLNMAWTIYERLGAQKSEIDKATSLLNSLSPEFEDLKKNYASNGTLTTPNV